MKKIGIIGAGPAGMMAGIIAKNNENEITIFDSNNDIGKKLLMTGGGRCNLTNIAYYDEFLENIVRNKKFIYSAFNKFDNYGLIEYLNKNGLDTITEEDGRVFPKSQRASDIISFFRKKLEENSVEFKLNTKIKKVYYDGVFYLTDSNNKTYAFDYLIVATGGKSYPKTGSDGYGYEIAHKLGHKIIGTSPVLVPIFIKNRLNIKAISLRDIRLSAHTERKQVTMDGDILINPNFITGPAALKLSSLIRGEKIDEISIDFYKDITYNDLDKKIIYLINENPRKSVENALKSLLNDSLLNLILERSGIDSNKKAGEFSKEERKILVDKIKNFELEFDRFGSFESAIVTRGGVDVREINPQNMESKLIKNLFFVGEILDIDGLTGGFNLQICFSTAYAAGSFIKENAWHI